MNFLYTIENKWQQVVNSLEFQYAVGSYEKYHHRKSALELVLRHYLTACAARGDRRQINKIYVN